MNRRMEQQVEGEEGEGVKGGLGRRRGRAGGRGYGME